MVASINLNIIRIIMQTPCRELKLYWSHGEILWESLYKQETFHEVKSHGSFTK